MPRLYWKNKPENVSTFGLSQQPSSTSIFQKEDKEHALGHPLLNFQRSNIPTPPPLPPKPLNIKTQPSTTSATNDYPLETFRAQLNGYHEKQSRTSTNGPVKALVNGNTDIFSSTNNNRSFNVTISSPFVLKDKLSDQLLRSTTPRTTKTNSVFDDTNLPDEDILAMAAQRDQQRGGGTTRYVRGMMGPISSKFSESRGPSARKYEVPKNKTGRSLDYQDENKTVSNGHVLNGSNQFFPSSLSRNSHNSEIKSRLSTANVDTPNRVLMGYRRTPSLHLDILNDQSNDILAQSVRRQSLKGSKYSLSESNLGNIAENSNSSLTLLAGIESDTKDSKGYRSEPDGLNGLSSNRRISVIPSSREDIQILNLQGFMDFGRAGTAARQSDDMKKKQRRRRNKLNEFGGIKLKDRKKRNRGRKMDTLSDGDDDDEVVLKDLDDIDDKISGLVLGPKASKESVGEPITVEEASRLRTLLMGSPSQLLSEEWMTQNFMMNTNPNLSYGLVQKKGGPCGVLACVQAHMMKTLIFGSPLSTDTTPVSPLRPSPKEWSWALSVGITELLWRAGGEIRAVLTLPGSFAHFDEHGIGRYNRDGVTETLSLHFFNNVEDLFNSVVKHLTVFTAPSSPGCVLLLYSVILSRGLDNVSEDMDAGGGHLINMHGYASQEVVNLMLTGRASTNTFDGDRTLQDDRELSTDKMVFKGVQARADIGMLSLFEHYGSCKVGAHLKSPIYPIWVVCSESHYSCLFSRDPGATNDHPKESTLTLYFYDGLALQEDEIKLTIDVSSNNDTEATLIPPLEHCIRTKWPEASIDWNGTDPIL